jgi:hypothetical protein
MNHLSGVDVSDYNGSKEIKCLSGAAVSDYDEKRVEVKSNPV